MRPVRRIWLPSDRLYARSSGQFEPLPLEGTPHPSMAKDPFLMHRYQLRLRAAAGPRRWGMKTPSRMQVFLQRHAPAGYI